MSKDWSNFGEVYTRRWVVDSMLDLIGYIPSADLGGKLLIEPSVGSGAFLQGIVPRLMESSLLHHRPAASLGGAIRAYDLLPTSVETSRLSISKVLIELGVKETVARQLTHEWINVSDFLLAPEIPDCDFVVGNPPYIRIEGIPEEVTEQYRTTWKTMKGRADIYVGFYERGLKLLKSGGALAFICADRWMKNHYGEKLRGLVSKNFSMDQVWTLHDVDAFESQVSAYPAITVVTNGPQGRVIVANTTSDFSEDSAEALTAWALKDSGLEYRGHGFSAHRMESWFETSDMWPSGTPSAIALIKYLNENFEPLEKTVRVGIGVATGADKTYIVRDAPVESDRLLPLSMSGDLRADGTFEWTGNYLVNPWSDSGALVDLALFPKLAAYFYASEKLRERHTAKKNPLHWYRTIDKVNPSLAAEPKLLIQDMRSNINPVLDLGGFYPHHNLYFMTSSVWDLEVLGGILISRIGQGFIEAYGVRMRGGTLRFQSQYLRKIRLPNFFDIKLDTKEQLRQAFRSRDVRAATLASSAAYGFDPSQYGLREEELVVDERQRG